MCIGSKSSSTEYRDTSEEPIISKYQLTAEQKAENARRRSLLKKKDVSVDTGGGDTDLGAGTSIGGLSSPSASSGNAIV